MACPDQDEKGGGFLYSKKGGLILSDGQFTFLCVFRFHS